MAEFHSVLRNYKPSQAAQKTLEGTTLVLLTAPTASGRNTIIDQLVKTGKYHFVVSDTTRKPRVNNGIPEQNGREYWFKTEEEVLEDLKLGRYFEAQLIHNQQVSGISMREMERAKSMHEIAINEVDSEGIAHILPIKPDTIGLLILPPNFDEWLRRVDSRGHMDAAERRRRFSTAAEIFAMAKDGVYPVIVNDRLEDAVHKVDRLARFGELLEDQPAARRLAKKLYEDTQAYLKAL